MNNQIHHCWWPSPSLHLINNAPNLKQQAIVLINKGLFTLQRIKLCKEKRFDVLYSFILLFWYSIGVYIHVWCLLWFVQTESIIIYIYILYLQCMYMYMYHIRYTYHIFIIIYTLCIYVYYTIYTCICICTYVTCIYYIISLINNIFLLFFS